VVHFVPFHASWLNMVEIWFGILKKKCLNYDHFASVAKLREAIMTFINTWNDFYAHPFTWSYTGEGLHQKAIRRFSMLLSIETPQMDCKFLTRQLLLMSNIAENYLGFVPVADWIRLIDLAVEKQDYMTNIIQSDSGPKRQKQAREAYTRFTESVINGSQPLAARAA
jgi:hypothetical protein